MSNKPRFSSAIQGQPASFLSLLMHTPKSANAFFELYARFWQQGVVAQEIKEMTRMRNARITDCGY